MNAPRTASRQQCREIDRRAIEDFGVPGIVLMENAGRGVAERLLALGVTGPVTICCGKGNNGGDGLVVARHLDARGIAVRVLLWAEPAALAGDAAVNYHIVRNCGLPLEVFGHTHDARRLERQLDGAAWIVDALFGTGFSGEPRPPLDQIIDEVNSHAAPKLAVDLPSGLDCDSGAAARHTIRARETCTFVAWKPGFLASGAAQYTGRVHVVEIGAPRALLDELLGGDSPA